MRLTCLLLSILGSGQFSLISPSHLRLKINKLKKKLNFLNFFVPFSRELKSFDFFVLFLMILRLCYFFVHFCRISLAVLNARRLTLKNKEFDIFF